MKKDEEVALERKTALDEWIINSPLASKYAKADLQGNLFSGFDTKPRCTINWKSSKQVIPLLKGLGFDLLVKDKKTGEMRYSVESKVISSQKDISTISEPFIKFGEAQKVISTYGQNIIDEINPVTGRLHTNFNQLGTDTNRLSSGGKDKENNVKYINMQNIPADKLTRSCFVAEPGNTWISCDYSSQEARLMAELSKDEAMIDLFNNGCGDTHSLVCKMAFPEIVGDCPVELIKKRFPELRNNTKSWVEFPINYGGGPNTIHQHSGKSMEDSDRIYNNYRRGFPGIANYQDTQKAFVNRNGYIILNELTRARAFIYDFDELKKLESSFTKEFWNRYRDIPKNENKKKVPRNQEESVMCNNVRHYFKRKSESERQSIDYKCQGSGAVMWKLACIFLWKYVIEHELVFKVKFVVPVHDEINIECPDSIAEEMTLVLKDCMLRAGTYFCKRVKMPADAEVGKCWIH